jgi:hypothetical protein
MIDNLARHREKTEKTENEAVQWTDPFGTNCSSGTQPPNQGYLCWRYNLRQCKLGTVRTFETLLLTDR